MMRWRAGTGASSEDVVEHETPDHRAAHEAHEYRRAADVPGLLRECVILEWRGNVTNRAMLDTDIGAAFRDGFYSSR